MSNPFEKADHDKYEEDTDQLDNSVNPDAASLPKPRDTDEPDLDAAP